MVFFIRNWFRESFSLFLQKDSQDTLHHNVQIIDIITYKNKKYYILRDRDFFIKSIVISKVNYPIGIFLNIKEYYLEYQNGEFILFVEKCINLGSLSDIPIDLTNINSKFNKEKSCKLYANWSYNALFFYNEKKLKKNSTDLLVDDVSSDFCSKIENINDIDLSFKDSDLNFICCLNKKNPNHCDSFVTNDFTFHSESFSQIFSDIENNHTLEINEDKYKLEINEDKCKFKKVGNIPTIEINEDKYKLEINENIPTIEINEKRSLPFLFPIFSKINFRRKKIKSRKRGKYLDYFEIVRNLKNLFNKKNIYKYTKNSKIKYFNILPSQNFTLKKEEIDEYKFLNDTLFDKDYLL